MKNNAERRSVCTHSIGILSVWHFRNPRPRIGGSGLNSPLLRPCVRVSRGARQIRHSN